MSFSDKLKMLRESFELKQEELGKKVQLSKPNISKYESGQIEPSIGTIIKFCEIFGVTSDYLLDIQSSAVTPHLSKSDESLLNKYNQLNDLGKEKTNEYVDILIGNEKYTKEENRIADINDKVYYVGLEDPTTYVAAYGGGTDDDDDTLYHT